MQAERGRGEVKIVLYVSAFTKTKSFTDIVSLNARVTDPRIHQGRQLLAAADVHMILGPSKLTLCVHFILPLSCNCNEQSGR